jgi:hypothetical protein
MPGANVRKLAFGRRIQEEWSNKDGSRTHGKKVSASRTTTTIIAVGVVWQTEDNHSKFGGTDKRNDGLWKTEDNDLVTR